MRILKGKGSYAIYDSKSTLKQLDELEITDMTQKHKADSISQRPGYEALTDR